MKKFSDRIYYLPFDEKGDRPNLGYIRGDKYSLMVDAGNSAAHVATYNAACRELGLKKPDFAALTHWHWDHVFGLHAVDCPAIASAQTNEHIAGVMQWTWTDEAMAERLRTGADNTFCDRTIREEYPDRSQIRLRLADITFDTHLTLDLGGITCELYRLENPHTADGVILYIPQERFIFLGDADCEGHHHGREPLYREKLAELMQTLQAIDFETLLQGHEPPMTRESAFAMWQEELAQ